MSYPSLAPEIDSRMGGRCSLVGMKESLPTWLSCLPKGGELLDHWPLLYRHEGVVYGGRSSWLTFEGREPDEKQSQETIPLNF